MTVTHVFLPDEPTERLLSDPHPACFAAAADPGALSVEALCLEVEPLIVQLRLAPPKRPDQLSVPLFRAPSAWASGQHAA